MTASLAAVLPLLALASPAPALAQQQQRVLTFEGLQSFEEVLEFYNGGMGSLGSQGPDFGVSFSPASLVAIDSDAGGTASICGEPSPSTVLGFTEGNVARMIVPDGFTEGFSFFYTAPTDTGIVRVYSGVDPTAGNLLAELVLDQTESACTAEDPGIGGPFVPVSVSFAGIARSVDFGGATGNIAFDNIALGLTPTLCEGPTNPFPADAIVVYPDNDNPLCGPDVAPIPPLLTPGLNSSLPVYVTAGDQPSDPNPIAGTRGPEVPCAMPLNLETSNIPDDRITASGDEICGLDVVIEVDSGAGVITDFTPEDMRTRVFPSPPFPDAKSVRLVGVYTDEPLASPFAHKLGEISIDTKPSSATPIATRVVAKAGVGAVPIGAGNPPYYPFDGWVPDNAYAPLGVGAMPASLTPRPTIQTVLYVPEPAAWLQVPSALLGLALLARLRRRRDD